MIYLAGTDFSHLTNDELIKGIQALNLPDYIRSKAYGVDVRETLAQMTEMTIQLGVNMGLSPDEALRWARKIQDIDAQLAQTHKEKISHGEVQKSDYDLSKESNLWNINDFDEETRQTFLEAQGIDVNYVLGKDSVKKENVSKNAINDNHIDFLTHGKNLFNGEYLHASIHGTIESGATLQPSANARSIIVPVKSNTTYTISLEDPLSDRFRIAVHSSYPEYGKYLDRYIKDENVSAMAHPYIPEFQYYTFTTKENENYIVVYLSISNNEPKVMVSEGEAPLEFEDYEIVVNRNVVPFNQKNGKNLFNGEYITGTITGSTEQDVVNRVTTNDGKLAVVNIKPNTTYAISKTSSNRFRIALSQRHPKVNDPVHLYYPIVDLVAGEENDENLEYIITSRETDRFLTIYVAFESEPPEFIQVEENDHITSWETYGNKMEIALPYSARSARVVESDTLSVEAFRVGSESDDKVIQKAFGNANGQVVSFESGREYLIEKTVVAKAEKVRGIKGNNATLVLNNDITGLRYEGTLTGNANPGSLNNRELDKKESNAFIERLRVTSKNGYEGNGIEIEKLLSANIEACHTFNLKNGIIVKGWNRNLIFENCHVRDNLENGLSFENVNLHQLNMTGMHIGYNKNGISIIDGEIANWQMSACDIESNSSSSYGQPESLINIETTEGGTTGMWEVNFSGLTIQGHGNNTKPLINIDVKEAELAYFALGSSHVSNSGNGQPLIYINGGWKVGISNVTMKGVEVASGSIVLGDNNNGVSITSCHLPAPVIYGSPKKLLISNNIASGFTFDEVDDGNVLIVNNL